MNRVGIVAKPDAGGARDVVVRLIGWLEERGRSVVLDKETAALVPDAPAAAVAREIMQQTGRSKAPATWPALRVGEWNAVRAR